MGRDIEKLLGVWRRRRWLALPVFLGPLTFALSVTAFLPDTYQSTATVLVERQQVPETFVQPTVTGALDTRLRTMSQEILSRTQLEELIVQFDLYRERRAQLPAEAVVARMRGDIRVEIQSGEVSSAQRGRRDTTTVAFTISYHGRDPEVVAKVTNTLASFYVQENLKVRERLASGTADFLKEQLADTKRRLDEQEQNVSEFKTRHLGGLPEQLTANLATLERLNAQLRLTMANQTHAVERRVALVQQFGGGNAVSAPGAPDEPEVRLARLRQDLVALRARFTEKYPEVVDVRSEIAALEQQLAARPREKTTKDGAEPVGALTTQASRLKEALAGLDAELKLLKSEEQSLRADITRYQRRVENTPRLEQEFQELSRNYQSTKELYTRLLNRYEEAQLAETLEQRQKGEQFRIIDPAMPSRDPVAPNRRRLAMIALMGSLGLAVGAVVLAEMVDGSFHSVGELRATVAVPVVGKIPRIVTGGESRRRRIRTWLGLSAGLFTLLALVGAAYVLVQGPGRLASVLSGGGL